MRSEDIEMCIDSGPVELVIDECDLECDNVGKTAVRESSPDVDDEVIYVPNNPRKWTEKNIETWVTWASKKFNLTPPLDAARFPKDAEEMAKYTKADFYIVCGSFEGGKRISQYFKYLMMNAGETFDDTLLTDSDPGELISEKFANAFGSGKGKLASMN